MQGVANQVLAQVDTTVDPCQDFDAFVCGKWRGANPLADGEGSVSATGLVEVRVCNKHQPCSKFSSNNLLPNHINK